jgi:hypothetical protein
MRVWLRLDSARIRSQRWIADLMNVAPFRCAGILVALLVAEPHLLPAGENLSAESLATDEAARRTIERSVPFIEREGVAWIETRKCVSCHQIPFMVWSLSAAKARGIAVDEQKLHGWTAWAVDYPNFSGPNYDPEKDDRKTVLSRNVDTMAQLLLGVSSEARLAPVDEWRSLFRESLKESQQESGMWNPCGQLPAQKRPLRETQEATTMWALLALCGAPDTKQPHGQEFEKGLLWLGNNTQPASTEWWAVRLLLEGARGESRSAEKTRQELQGRQHEDGGWGWLSADESDALATGMALYALKRSGLAADHPAILKARAYLCRTQGDDGSWQVRGTKKNKKDRIEPTAVYWGTCWAVIGLAETLK